MAVYGAVAARRAGSATRDHHARRPLLRRGMAAARRASLGHARSAATTAVSAATAADCAERSACPTMRYAWCLTGSRCRAARAPPFARELAVGDDELLIVAIGNLYPVKGHAVLLRALVELEEQGGVPPGISPSPVAARRSAAPMLGGGCRHRLARTSPRAFDPTRRTLSLPETCS